MYLESNLSEKTSNLEYKSTESYKSEIKIQIKKGFFIKNYFGDLIYNNNSLDLKINSGQEILEIGFNEIYFWYFSSYDPVFYYGENKNSSFILIEIFNPINLLDIIFPKKENIAYGNYGKILNKKIEFKNNKINKVYFYENYNLIYYVEYKKYLGDFPVEIDVYYKKENIRIKIIIKKIENINYNFSLPIKKYKKVEKLLP